MITIKKLLKISAKLAFFLVIAIFIVLYLEPRTAHAATEHLSSKSSQLLLTESHSVDPRLNPGSVFYGEAQPLGEGSMRTWAKFYSNGNLSDIGVSLTEAALSSLPKETDNFKAYPLKLKLQDGSGFSTFEYELMFPKEISTAPFTHVSLNTNPYGHGPEKIYDAEHFDFHFNLISPEERYVIVVNDYDEFVKRATLEPPEEFLPTGYETVPMTAEPRMGAHWFDLAGSEFYGEHWLKSFNIGCYDGEIVFWEPMVSTAYLATKPNVSIPIKQPPAYPQSGYYPTKYSINYANGEYSVSLNGLTFRSGKLSTVVDSTSSF